MKKWTRIVSVVIGVVFLVSGYAKSADAAYFSNLLGLYGADSLGYMAPVVILSEITLGCLLLTGICTRPVAWLSVAMLSIVSGGYAYGLARYGIVDCGCFGHLYMLNLSPAFTFVRNAVLIALLVWIGLKGDRTWQLTPIRTAITVVGMLIGGFATGFTFHDAHVLLARDRVWAHRPVDDTPLGKYVELSSDSTYMVFAFSFSCPYCNQSMGNVSLYEKTGTVDRTIGLALADSAGEAAFREYYSEELPLQYRVLGEQEMVEITGDKIPTLFLIRHDSIVFMSRQPAINPRFIGKLK